VLGFFLQHFEYLLRVHFEIIVLIVLVDTKLVLGASSYSESVTGFRLLEVIHRLVLVLKVKFLEATGMGHLLGIRISCQQIAQGSLSQVAFSIGLQAELLIAREVLC
jgi:hypothetical protein